MTQIDKNQPVIRRTDPVYMDEYCTVKWKSWTFFKILMYTCTNGVMVMTTIMMTLRTVVMTIYI